MGRVYKFIYAQKEGTVEYHYNKAVELALQRVRGLVKKILKENPQFDHFVMGNGDYDFRGKDNNYVEKEGADQELCDFIDEWDDYLRLTGTPMKIYSTGKVITNW
jgi:hypothetical protein